MGTGIFVRLVFILNKILAAFNMKFIPPWRRGLFIEIGLDEDINIKEKLAKLVECNLTNDFFFLQIGANDGVSFDPIHQLVTRYKLKGICIEPIEEYFQELTITYKDLPNVKLIQKAVTDKIGTRVMYKVDSNLRSSLPEWSKGIASLNSNHHKRSGVNSNCIIPEEVETISFDGLITGEQIEQLDLLVIDAEGYDIEIIKSIDFNKIKPRIIFFEHKFLDNVVKSEDLSDVINNLNLKGYLVYIGRNEVLAFLP
tara:strand:- start:8309 stop:9073 length:765 start_codon:yes stop_codon:yes gene_type:complete